MVETETHFQKRLSTLGRKHAAMAKGYDMQMRRDGLVVVKAKRGGLRRFFPLKGLALLLLGFFVFKGFMVASLGDVTYNERLAKLNQGTTLEQAGAQIMQIDGATAFLASYMAPLIR